MKQTGAFLIFMMLASVTRLEAHAFIQQAEPGVGSIVQVSPNEVRIRFTEKIEPAFSKIQVFAASGKEVDKRDVHLDHSDPALLIVSLPKLGTGTYKVVWRVVSIDTHHGGKLHFSRSLGNKCTGTADASYFLSAGRMQIAASIQFAESLPFEVVAVSSTDTPVAMICCTPRFWRSIRNKAAIQAAASGGNCITAERQADRETRAA